MTYDPTRPPIPETDNSDDIRSTLSKAMTDECEGQFLWLKMQEKSLRKGINKKQLQHTIKETPAGLDQLYDRSWQRITQALEGEATYLRPIALGGNSHYGP